MAVCYHRRPTPAEANTMMAIAGSRQSLDNAEA